jgi:hypothetical protein
MMGKKYEAYEKAVQANKAATSREVDTRGGSTKDTRHEALTNRVQAQKIEDEAWDRLMDEPTG